MAGDLLARILSEIRARKRAAQAAYEEAQQLERALAALDAKPTGSAGQRRSKGGRPGRQSTSKATGKRARRGANREVDPRRRGRAGRHDGA